MKGIADAITQIQLARSGRRSVQSGGLPMRGRLARLVANLGDISMSFFMQKPIGSLRGLRC